MSRILYFIWDLPEWLSGRVKSKVQKGAATLFGLLSRETIEGIVMVLIDNGMIFKLNF